MGLLRDGYNSAIRYYYNNFYDGFRQVCSSVYNLLPRQHLRMLPISLLYRLYNSHIPPWGVVLHIGVGLRPTPMCKTTTPQGRDTSITNTFPQDCY